MGIGSCRSSCWSISLVVCHGPSSSPAAPPRPHRGDGGHTHTLPTTSFFSSAFSVSCSFGISAPFHTRPSASPSTHEKRGPKEEEEEEGDKKGTAAEDVADVVEGRGAALDFSSRSRSLVGRSSTSGVPLLHALFPTFSRSSFTRGTSSSSPLPWVSVGVEESAGPSSVRDKMEGDLPERRADKSRLVCASAPAGRNAIASVIGRGVGSDSFACPS